MNRLVARLAVSHMLIAAGAVAIVRLTGGRWPGAGALAITIVASAALAILMAIGDARELAGPLRRLTAQVGGRARSGSSIVAGGPAETRALAEAIDALARELLEQVEAAGAGTALRDQILSAMTEGVLLIEGDRVVYANPAARTLLNTGEDDPVPPGLPAATGEAVGRDIVVHHPAYRELRCVVVPLMGRRHLALVADVTESNRIDRMRRDFVANASHEMKTPVASVLATAETLEMALGDDPEAAARFARTLTAEARRLSSLIGDLLDLSRLDRAAGGAEEVSLSVVVNGVVSDLRSLAEEKGLTLKIAVLPAVIVRGDADDLALLVRNLLDNAIRYTPEGGTVSVGLATESTAAVLEVRDSGIGIPSRDLPRIFERFYRVDRARSRETGGTGLGLAIVRHVAAGHGGVVTAESELSAGSVFTVRLPLDAPG